MLHGKKTVEVESLNTLAYRYIIISKIYVITSKQVLMKKHVCNVLTSF